MLQDRGLLSIEQPITKFISGAPADYRNITISHLLNHTAGVPNYTDIPGFWAQHSARDVTPSEATDYFMSLPLDFAPGERFNYSNSGYLLLGRVIEAVAQCRYGEFLQNEIFRPLEMDDTSYLANAPATKQSASGYVLRAGTFQNAAIMSMTWPHASGALGSSVLDLVKWQIALSSGKLVSRNTLTVMHQPTILNDGSQSSYGFGWMIGDRGGQRYPHHSGSINGFASHMAWFPEGDVTVAVLSNLVSFPATNLGDKLAHAAFLVD
jgi:CubicO group peptidase (beta-lactamase class C family)